MATVLFSDPEEFLTELTRDRDLVDRRIVRLQSLGLRSGITSIHFLTVVATTRVGQDVIRLERLCGGLCGAAESDQRVTEMTEAVRQELESGCARLGLEVRSGVLEELT